MKDKSMDFIAIHPVPPTNYGQSTASETPVINDAGRPGRRGLTVVAAVFAAVSLTAAPITAHARDNGAGIALGVLGGVVAGAAIASTANSYNYGSGYGYYGYPTYTAPAQSYYAPQNSYYPQSTYYSASPYYGNYGSSYAPYYGNSYYYDGR
jgi:hypothetical protein